jgi:hypothetical protein
MQCLGKYQEGYTFPTEVDLGTVLLAHFPSFDDLKEAKHVARWIINLNDAGKFDEAWAVLEHWIG